MTLTEMKKKVLALIEELNPDSELLTDDPDISTKINDVINQIMFELARHKKIPDYVELKVNEGDIITYEDIKDETDYNVYQIYSVKGAEYELKAQGTVIKALETGTLEIEYFRYPTRITNNTKADRYTFELTDDVLEIMPYGIAGDLLKSDVSTNYGAIYSQRYEELKQLLDPRHSMGAITFEGGIGI